MLQKGRFRFLAKKWCLLSLAVLLLLPTGLNGERVTHANNGEAIMINPTPQQLTERGEGFALTSTVGLVVGEATDAAAIREVEAALKEANVEQIERTSAEDPLPETSVTIWIGGPSENAASAEALERLDTQGPDELREEGYVFVSDVDESGKSHIVLAGKDQVGTFYAAQTFKQIIQERSEEYWVPAVEIRDWPEMPIRGAIEGFYGPPWSHEDRLEQLRFYGEHKMNAYIYAPKDDPYHREKWREPYPEDELAALQALVEEANDQHITFTFAISPGNTICFSDDDDFEALLEKAEAVWDLGVRSYAIFLDDIDPSLRCAADRETFGDDRNPPASAQAYLLNRFNEEFIQTHEGAEPLITVPTEYSQAGTSPYREEFADKVDPDIIVQWTGIGVVAPTITKEDAEKIHGIFKHDLLIWDNYPVNDYDRNRLFLHPLVGREAHLTEHGVIGLTANPMNEAEASKIPLYTIADYVWNSSAYDPDDSWERSLRAFGGDVADALKTFAEQSYSSQLNETESPTLAPLIEAFWDGYESGDFDAPAQELLEEFERIQNAPTILRDQLQNEKFLEEVSPYLDKTELYGKAGVAAVNMLVAKKENNDRIAREQRQILENAMQETDKISQKVGEGELDAFLERARWGRNLALKQPVEVNNYWQNNPNFNGDKAVDGDLNTRWATGWGVQSGWLVVNFPEEVTVNQTVLWEHKEFGDRIQAYDIQYWDGTDWVTVTSGGVTSAIQVDQFSPVTTNKIRLNITSATFEPTVAEFGVYNVDDLPPPSDNAADMKALVERFAEEGEFEDDRVTRSLKLHLIAVDRYENREAADKVVKHLESFKQLLDHQREKELISERAYHSLKSDTEYLIQRWR